MKISIKIKSSVFLAILLLLTVSILSSLVLQGIKKDQQRQHEEYLAGQAKVANIYVREIYLMKPTENPEEFLQKNAQEIAKQLKFMNDMNNAIYDMSGEEIGELLQYPNKKDFSDILSYALDDNIAYEIEGDSMVYMAPLYIEGRQIGVIQFQNSIKVSGDFYKKIKSLFISIGMIVFIFSFIVGYFYFNRLAEGILKLKKDALNIKNGKYDDVVPLERNDEIGELSEDIYYMSSQIKKNIGEMEQEQEKLRLAVKKLKKLEKQQKAFIGNITHEFKTPLTVIKAYVDLLDMYLDDPQLITDAKTNIGKETIRLYEMVDKILKLASLEKYDFELQSEKVDIKEVIEEICKRMKGKAKKYNLSLNVNLKSAFILGDKESLMQIFINLIDNAIKYNKSGGEIFVDSYIKNENLFIEVSNTGSGIPKDSREKIFEPFYTVNKDRSKQNGGTGLGLSLVKELVEKQRGTISLVDSKKSAITFRVSFPCL